MGADMLERDDLSVYIVAGVPKSFKRKLQAFVAEEAKSGDGEVMLLEDGFADWIVSRLADEKRPRSNRTPASKALWSAFSALSAARYHLQHSEEEERVRELRQKVEELWRETSPMFPEEGPGAEGDDDPEAAGGDTAGAS
ncbi:MAG TPA: hypothetical protein VK912_14975 [Longimicrobiales bacterium]|nr:hypothetical protein [Longimicrobiales bacterium]